VKKVRYALGAIGIAPVIGMVMPVPTATAATRVPVKTAKRVSLLDARGRTVPDLTCHSPHVTSPHRSIHGLRIQVGYSNGDSGCIAQVHGEISTAKTGLEMRTRVYSVPGGSQVFQNYVHGDASILGGYTAFSTKPNVHGEQVCIALVESKHHSVIVDSYGPVCQTV
jgi:hypothetical protein